MSTRHGPALAALAALLACQQPAPLETRPVM